MISDTESIYVQAPTKLTTVPFEEKARFFFTNNDRDTLEEVLTFAKVKPSAELISSLVDTGFWELIITDIQETHMDASAVNPVFADTMIATAMGARPIGMSISGFLSMTQTQDHRMDFLYLYHNVLRGSISGGNSLPVMLSVKDTTCRIYITGITLNTNANIQDHVAVTITGIACDYLVRQEYNVINAYSQVDPVQLSYGYMGEMNA